MQKINYFRQQAFYKDLDKLTEILLTSEQFERYKVNSHEIVIENVFYDIKSTDLIADGNVKLLLKQDLFETFLVFTAANSNLPHNKKENKFNDLQLPADAIRIEYNFQNVAAATEYKSSIYLFLNKILKGFHALPSQPPELFA
ncbi:MAG: hypothetical protein ACOYOA_09880 [Saprospiraceae bacterium]